VDSTGTSLPLPPAFAGVKNGQAMIVGIRPEALRVAGEPTDNALPAVAEVVELTGPELVATMRLGTDGQKIVAALPARTRLDKGEQCRLTVDAESIHLFDPETGKAVARAG
jgi:multiple sugar transport system ATP-binding protein